MSPVWLLSFLNLKWEWGSSWRHPVRHHEQRLNHSIQWCSVGCQDFNKKNSHSIASWDAECCYCKQSSVLWSRQIMWLILFPVKIPLQGSCGAHTILHSWHFLRRFDPSFPEATYSTCSLSNKKKHYGKRPERGVGRKTPRHEANPARETQGHGEQELGEQLSQVLPADQGLSDEPRVRQGASDLQRRRLLWNVHPHVDVWVTVSVWSRALAAVISCPDKHE